MRNWNPFRRTPTAGLLSNQEIRELVRSLPSGATGFTTVPATLERVALSWVGAHAGDTAVVRLRGNELDRFVSVARTLGYNLENRDAVIRRTGIEAAQQFLEAHEAAVEAAKIEVQRRAEELAPGHVLHRVWHDVHTGRDISSTMRGATFVKIDVITDVAVVTVSKRVLGLLDCYLDDWGGEEFARPVKPGTVPSDQEETVTAFTGRSVSWHNGTLTIGDGHDAHEVKLEAQHVPQLIRKIAQVSFT